MALWKFDHMGDDESAIEWNSSLEADIVHNPEYDFHSRYMC